MTPAVLKALIDEAFAAAEAHAAGKPIILAALKTANVVVDNLVLPLLLPKLAAASAAP